MTGRVGIVVPVWHNYRWIAPFTSRLLREFWPGHPPAWYGGLTAAEAAGLPSLPLEPGADQKNWSQMLLGAVREMRGKGFEFLYVITEEHVPLAPCSERHLNGTLPALMDSLDAVYIALMGWDNRRYTSKSPLLGKYRLKHLIREGDPRFHLHPALWRIDVLESCCLRALEDRSKNGSAWHFEKVNALSANGHPEDWKRRCYQICGEEMADPPLSFGQKKIHQAGCFIFHKLMALYPLIPSRRIANAYAHWVGFNNFLFRGPYPMFYSGLMCDGTINAFFAKHASKSAHGRKLLEQLRNAEANFLSHRDSPAAAIGC